MNHIFKSTSVTAFSLARSLLTALLATLSSPVAASEGQCDIQEAAERQRIEISETSRNIAQRMLDDTAALQALMDSRDWVDGEPMIDQMSAEEASKFEELRQAVANRQIASLIPSKRKRDISAISEMAVIAEAIANEEFEFQQSSDKSSEELFLAAILFAARENLPMAADDTFPNAKGRKECVLTSTLYMAADQAVEYANDYPFLLPAIEEMARLNKIYPNLSEASVEMNERDKKGFMESRRIVRGATKHLELANDYLRLALMEETSQLLYESWMRDLFESPGDIEAIGKTWQSWVEAGRVSENQIFAAGLLFTLNEKIPAEIVKQWEQYK